MTPRLKKIIITLLLIGLMFILYTLLKKPQEEADQLIDAGNAETSIGMLGIQISQALLRIEQITLDKSIFDDNLYQSLQDRSVDIATEPRGRDNPFAPIGTVSSSTTTSTENQSDISAATASDAIPTNTAPASAQSSSTTQTSQTIPVSPNIN